MGTGARLGDVSMTAADEPSVAAGGAAFTRREVLASAAAGLVASSNLVPASAETTLATKQAAYTRYVPRIENARDFWSGSLLTYLKNEDWDAINKELVPVGPKSTG